MGRSETKMDYRADIDGLRAFAVGSVLLFHMSPSLLPSGYTGVDVFFVVSGFVVAGSLWNSETKGIGSFISAFYARRLRRLLPALLTVLVVTFILRVLFIPNAWVSSLVDQTGLAAFLGFSNFVLSLNGDNYFAPRAESNPFTHTWSLGVEEQFYLVAPIILYIFNIGNKLLKLFALFALLVTAGISIYFLVTFQHSNTNVAFYSIFTRFWQLGAGVLLFLLMHGLGKEIRAPFFVSFFISSIGFVAILCGFFMVPPQGFPWPYALLPTLGTMMLIAGNGLSEQNHIRRFLSSGYLVDIGKRSYSIYLWHWPVIVLMGWTVGIGDADSVLIAIAITLTLSEISYRLIETPLRRSDKLQSFKKRTQIFSMISAAVVSLGISFILVANTDSLSLSEANRNAQVWYPDRGMPTPHPGVINCRLEQLPDTSATPVAVFAPTDCNGAELANVEGLSGRLFVVGDSHAGMLVPALTFFAQETGVEVRVLYGAGCPYIDLAKPSDHITTPRQCTIAKSRIDEYLLQNLRAGDVLLLPSLRLPRFRDQSSHELAQGLEEVMFSADASALRALAMSEARQTLAQFEQTGASVLITAPTPVFRAPAFRCVDWFNKNSELCKNNLSIAKDEISRAHARVVADLASLREQSGNLHIFDMLDHFCDSNACFAVSNEYPLFFDGDHLSAFGNKVIYPPLKLAIIEALGLTGAAYDRVLNDTTQRSAKMRTLLGMQVNEDFLHPDLADWILESSMDLSDGDFLSLSYQRVLGRAPDPEGKSYWIGRLESGDTRRRIVDDLIYGLRQGSE